MKSRITKIELSLPEKFLAILPIGNSRTAVKTSRKDLVTFRQISLLVVQLKLIIIM